MMQELFYILTLGVKIGTTTFQNNLAMFSNG